MPKRREANAEVSLAREELLEDDNLNNDDGVVSTEDKPVINGTELRLIENLIEKSAQFTKRSLKKTPKERYQFLNIEENETMNEEAEKTHVENPDFIQNGSLRDYQLAGLNWVLSLHDRGLNGILADEMGLGKTLQTISVLGHIKNVLGIEEPHLVIVPKSTARQWHNEINRFCPSLRALVLMGAKDGRKELVAENFKKGGKFDYDVLITSYDIALIESTAIKKINWYYIVIDEAHRIKNTGTRLAAYVRQLRTKHRLLLTGTPLQNNLNELWSLLNFLLPEIFSSSEEFDEIFDEKTMLGLDKTEAEAATAAAEATTEAVPKLASKEELVGKLRAIIKPFLLRRLKAEVEKSIPPKNEIYLYAELTQMQRDLYKSLLLKDITLLKGVAKEKQTGISKLMQVGAQVRKCCSHPYLFDGIEQGPPYVTDKHIVNVCGKMIVLDKLLEHLRRGGHRCLVFAQFLRTMDIIEDYLMWKNLKYFRLDGSTDLELRQQMIDAFNDPRNHDEYFVFLISTRAGGLGINLATADTVIFYDSDWNPQVDLQAMDRAHRIGQLKPVNVYRIITEHTIEERILSRASYKMNLDRCVIQKKRGDGDNDDDDPLILSKDDAIATLNRGLDFILRSNNNKRVDVEQNEIDIDTLIEKSKKIRQVSEKDIVLTKETIELNREQFKQNLIKLGSMDGYTVYDFEGQNYRCMRAKAAEKTSITKNRLRATSRIQYFKNKDFALKKFRFYPHKLAELIERDTYAEKRLLGFEPVIDERIDPELAMRRYNAEKEKIRNAQELSKSEQDEKNRLMKMAFENWTKGEFNLLCQAMRLYGRVNYTKLEEHVKTKTIDEIKAYLSVFWKRVHELSNSASLVRGIERAEERIKEQKQLTEALRKKFINVTDRFTDIQLNLYQSDKLFTLNEDKALLYLYYKLKPVYLRDDTAEDKAQDRTRLFERIRHEIRFVKKFRFNWHFLSCSTATLQSRCLTLLHSIRHENHMTKTSTFDENHNTDFTFSDLDQNQSFTVVSENNTPTLVAADDYDTDIDADDSVQCMDVDHHDATGNISSSSSSSCSSVDTVDLNSKRKVLKKLKTEGKQVLKKTDLNVRSELDIRVVSSSSSDIFKKFFHASDMETDYDLPII